MIWFQNKQSLILLIVKNDNCNFTEEFTTDFDHLNTTIVHIHFANNSNLTGTLNFGEFMPNLTSVSITNCGFNGEFSDYGFTKLKDINALKISNNTIYGSIPNEGFILEPLNFQVANNNLSGSIPEIFSSTRYVASFEINNNNFTGKLPGGYQT